MRFQSHYTSTDVYFYINKYIYIHRQYTYPCYQVAPGKERFTGFERVKPSTTTDNANNAPRSGKMWIAWGKHRKDCGTPWKNPLFSLGK